MIGIDAVETAELVRRRAASPVELVARTLDALAASEPHVNAFTSVHADAALAGARRAEQAVMCGAPLRPLHGVPVSLKECLWIAGEPTTGGSRARRDFVAPHDDVVVTRLRAAGAIVVGRTNQPELCLGADTGNRLFGRTRNPWALGRSPGGSSGGAGASLAAGGPPLAIGSDGGGSIRIPAAFCGVAGLRPTFGLVARGPAHRELWKSLTVVGPLARSARDLELALRAIAGPAAVDDDSRALAAEPDRPRRLRVACSADLGGVPVEPAVQAAFAAAVVLLRAAGWDVEEAHPPLDGMAEAWATIALCEGWASHRHLLDAPELLEPRTAAILAAGGERSLADYLDAVELRRARTAAWLRFFERFDLLLTPTTGIPAFDAGAEPDDDEWAAFCMPAALTGQPAASVPCGLSPAGLPIGLQIVGRRGADATVLRAAAAWEALAPALARPAPPPLSGR